MFARTHYVAWPYSNYQHRQHRERCQRHTNTANTATTCTGHQELKKILEDARGTFDMSIGPGFILAGLMAVFAIILAQAKVRIYFGCCQGVCDAISKEEEAEETTSAIL